MNPIYLNDLSDEGIENIIDEDLIYAVRVFVEDERLVIEIVSPGYDEKGHYAAKPFRKLCIAVNEAAIYFRSMGKKKSMRRDTILLYGSEIWYLHEFIKNQPALYLTGF